MPSPPSGRLHIEAPTTYPVRLATTWVFITEDDVDDEFARQLRFLAMRRNPGRRTFRVWQPQRPRLQPWHTSGGSTQTIDERFPDDPTFHITAS